MSERAPDMTQEDRATTLQRVVTALYYLSLAFLLFSIYNKSATALNNIGLYLPILLWPLRRAMGTNPGHYLRDPLLWRALAFVAVLGLSCLWSPDAHESLGKFRKEVAAVLILALTFAEAGSDRRTLQRWCVVLVVAAAWMAGLDVRDWWSSWKIEGNLLPAYGFLRDYGYGIVFALPFLFVVREFSGSWVRLPLGLLILLLAVLVVVTGSRGSWFAFVAIMAGCGLFLHVRRAAIAMIFAALCAALLFVWIEPANPITANVGRGVDSSYRRMGAWVPAATMMAERPAIGFGYGKYVFDDEYNSRKPDHPEWELAYSMGPHSLYFEVGFAAGLPGLAALIFLVAGFVQRAWSLSRGEPGWRRSMSRAILLSFAGQYLIYGFIESISWQPLGVHLGLLLALTASMAGAREDARPSGDRAGR